MLIVVRTPSVSGRGLLVMPTIGADPSVKAPGLCFCVCVCASVRDCASACVCVCLSVCVAVCVFVYVVIRCSTT